MSATNFFNVFFQTCTVLHAVHRISSHLVFTESSSTPYYFYFLYCFHIWYRSMNCNWRESWDMRVRWCALSCKLRYTITVGQYLPTLTNQDDDRNTLIHVIKLGLVHCSSPKGWKSHFDCIKNVHRYAWVSVSFSSQPKSPMQANTWKTMLLETNNKCCWSDM